MKNILLSMLGLCVGLQSLGCDDPLKSVELIAEPRVLGARVDVAGEPGRAAPAPGDSATVTFLLASPASPQSLGFALAVCPAAAQRGRAGCETPAFAQVVSRDGEADVARLTFDVPASLDASGRLLLLGVICPAGSPNADGTSCDGADPGTPVQLELELAHDGDVNLNPELQADSIGFDDAAWPELPALTDDCAGLGFPEVAVKSKHRVVVRLDARDRDALPHPSKLDPTRETLQLSHFVTGGDITRAFETIAWDDGDLKREVSWTAPKQPGLVRFWFVLRDFRGGSAFVERAVCVE